MYYSNLNSTASYFSADQVKGVLVLQGDALCQAVSICPYKFCVLAIRYGGGGDSLMCLPGQLHESKSPYWYLRCHCRRGNWLLLVVR